MEMSACEVSSALLTYQPPQLFAPELNRAPSGLQRSHESAAVSSVTIQW